MTDDSHSAPTVLVVGAGPVGLTMACELRRRGVPCRIIDAGDGPTPVEQSRALGIHARTLELLEGIGLSDHLVRAGRRIDTILVHDRNRRAARIELDFSGTGTPYPFVLVLSQGATERALIDALSGLGGAVEWRTRLTELRQDSDGVTAVIEQRHSGRMEEARTGWLIGCDGARSAVRHALELSFEGRSYQETFLLADVPIEWNLSPDRLQLILTREGPLPAIPLPEPGRWRLIAQTEGDSDDSEAIVDCFRDLLRDAGWSGAKVGPAIWASRFRIHRRAVDRLRIGRCFLAGDAAHIHSPVGAQGMNIGIHDACSLAGKLARVAKGSAPDSILDAYDADRLPAARSVLRGTHLATKITVFRGPIARSIRRLAAAVVSRSPAIRRRLTRKLAGLDRA